MKYSLTAVIPVVQYGNLQPTVEVEADTFAEAHALAMSHIETVWAQYGEKPLPNTQASKSTSRDGYVKLISPFGGECWYNDAEHIYKDAEGNILLSGSTFAKKYVKAFEKQFVIPKKEAKYNIDGGKIDELWTMKRDVAASFGTALHKALELYGKHKETADKIEKPLVLHPVLQPLVEAFYKGRESEKALYEPFITDGTHVGFIDRLVITGKNNVIIEDYKTNMDINKGIGKMLAPFTHMKATEINKYALQLNFYREILEKRGYVVDGMRVHHLNNGAWDQIEIPVIDLKEVLWQK